MKNIEIENNKVKPEKNLFDLYKGLGNLKYDFRNCNLINLLIPEVVGDSVLDVGCGSGFLLGILNKNGKKTFGIEPNKKLISLAKNINPELTVFEGVAEDIDKVFKQKVDTITLIDVLEHIKDDKLVIKNIRKHINDGGRLVLVVPAFKLLYGKRDKNIGHYRRYSKKELIQILSENGFKIKSIRYWNMIGFFPYLFYEKILKRGLDTELRTERGKKYIEKILNQGLYLWFKHVENNFSFGCGLSLICITDKE